MILPTILTSILLHISLCQQVLLSRYINADINIPAGFHIISMKVSTTYIYAAIANGAQMQVIKIDWANGYTIADSSQLFNFYADLTAPNNKNPYLMIKHPHVLVRGVVISSFPFSMFTFAKNNLADFNFSSKAYKYIGEYLTSLNSYYLLKQNGVEKIIQNFLGP